MDRVHHHSELLSLDALLGARLRTPDSAEAGVIDALIDPRQWSIPFLTAEADAWAPHRECLISTSTITAADPAAAEIDLILNAAELRQCPKLGDDVDARIGTAGAQPAQPPANWERQWQARTDPELAEEQPSPPTAMAAGTVEADLDELIRFSTLRQVDIETLDQRPAWLVDALVNDSQWTLVRWVLSTSAPDHWQVIPSEARDVAADALAFNGDPDRPRMTLTAAS